MTEMIGFSLVNLLVPDEPADFSVQGPIASWSIAQTPIYPNQVSRLSKGTSCAETYHAVAQIPRRQIEDAFREFRNMCLVFSYLTGSAVTIKRTVPGSFITLLQAGDGFPRQRGLSGAGAVVSDLAEFRYKAEQMLRRFQRQIATNHIDIIIHHLMDAFMCWSLEDLLLNSFTIMEMIQQNERKYARNPKLYLYDAITKGSQRLRISRLSRDFHKMRQDLIHEGKLSACHFAGRSKQDCASVCVHMLNWIDKYIHKVFRLNVPRPARHRHNCLVSLNSYSLW